MKRHNLRQRPERPDATKHDKTMVKYSSNKREALQEARERAKKWAEKQGQQTKSAELVSPTKKRKVVENDSTPPASPDLERKILSSATKKQKKISTPKSSRKKARTSPDLAPGSADTVPLSRTTKSRSPVKSVKKSNRQRLEESRAKARMAMENPVGNAATVVPVSKPRTRHSTAPVSKTPVSPMRDKKIVETAPVQHEKLASSNSIDGESDSDTEVLPNKESTVVAASDHNDEMKEDAVSNVSFVKKIVLWMVILLCFFPAYHLLNPESANPLVVKSGEILKRFLPVEVDETLATDVVQDNRGELEELSQDEVNHGGIDDDEELNDDESEAEVLSNKSD